MLFYQIQWSNRLLGSRRRTHNTTYDGTDCHIHEQRPFSGGWWSHKFNGPGVRYLIGISVSTSEIVDIKGPFPCGHWPDLKIFRQHVIPKLSQGEKVVADRGFRGEPNFVTTKDNCESPAAREKVNRLLARHESANKHFKDWKILSEKFRHDIKRHRTAFFAVAAMVQIELKTGYPLFDA
jgi:hypothetical protein